VRVRGIHHRELGDGEPLLLLHPGPGLDGSVFFPWFERLARHYRVIAPDLPGNGRSADGAAGEWNLSGLATAIGGFAAALGLERYTLLGHSFGGFVALTHAVESPGRVTRLIASCTAASESVFDGIEARVHAFEPADVREEVIAAFEAEETVRTSDELREAWAGQLPFFLADPTGPVRDDLVERWRDVAYRCGVVSHDWGELELVHALPALDIPVLAIVGAEDRSTPPSASRQIAETVPRGEYAEIAQAGHFPFAERPDEYFGALEDWLTRTA
jgi:proline iminopeptidase